MEIAQPARVSSPGRRRAELLLTGVMVLLSLPGFVYLALCLSWVLFQRFHGQYAIPPRIHSHWLDGIFIVPRLGIVTYPIGFIVALVASLSSLRRAVKVRCWLILVAATACGFVATSMIEHGVL